MELRQLKAFSTVAKTRNFTRAAGLLDYAQSSITAQVRSLEEELGTKLFERLGRQIAITKDGERLLVYAEQILKLSTEAKEVVSISAVPRGTISIGAPESLCVYRLAALLQEYRKRYSDVEIILKLGSCEDLLHWLKTNAIDVAFLLDRGVISSDLVTETLLNEPMVVLAGDDHPLIKKAHITPQDIHGESLILTESGCSYRDAFESILAGAGVRPGSVLEFGSVEAIKKCVISGLGITLLPRMAVEVELEEGRLVDLHWGGPELNITTQVAHHKDKWISPAMDVLLKLSRELLQPEVD